MLKGQCSTCGFVFDLGNGFQCPACHEVARLERVRQTFAPIDPLRTALGIEGKRPKNAEEWKQMRDELTWGYLRGKKFSVDYNRYPGRLCSSVAEHCEEVKLAEVPEDCKIPIDEAAQVYELRRLFKL